MTDNSSEQSARRDILRHARTLFSKKGFDGVSVREISKISGQNISMISYYFGGKEGLYKAILSEQMIMMTGQVDTIFVGFEKKEMTENSFAADIKSLVSLIVGMKFGDPEMMSLMQRERVDGLPFARELHEQLISPHAERLLEVFKEAQRKKIIRSGFNPGVFLGILFESVIGYMNSYDCGIKALRGDYVFPRDKDKFIDFLTDLFLQGIMK